MRLIDRVRNYKRGTEILNDWLSSECRVVDSETANKRAAICIKCPLQVSDWKITEAIAVAIREQVSLKNHLKLRCVGEKKLAFCSVCGCCNKLKVHVPIQHLVKYETPESLSKFHQDCWLIHEYNETFNSVADKC